MTGGGMTGDGSTGRGVTKDPRWLALTVLCAGTTMMILAGTASPGPPGRRPACSPAG
jgi:hypothetical protein